MYLPAIKTYTSNGIFKSPRRVDTRIGRNSPSFSLMCSRLSFQLAQSPLGEVLVNRVRTQNLDFRPQSVQLQIGNHVKSIAPQTLGARPRIGKLRKDFVQFSIGSCKNKAQIFN